VRADEGSAPVPIDVTLEFVVGSAAVTLTEIAPYRDALTVSEYRVAQVHEGVCEHRVIRVAHWVYWDGHHLRMPGDVAGSIRLRIEPMAARPHIATFTIVDSLPDGWDTPLYLDVTTVDPESGPRAPKTDGRSEYGCSLTDNMPTFLKLMPQLRLVVLGDSRGQAGVVTDRIGGDVNRHTPIAYNLGVESSGLELNELLVDTYLAHMPALRCIVYCLSPRVFNERWRDPIHWRCRGSCRTRPGARASSCATRDVVSIPC
jgi:hypothetical protein